MSRRAWLHGTSAVLVVLVTVSLAPVRAAAFAPKHHMDVILDRLEDAGYSEGAAWLLAYFSIEVDMATELPDELCWWPIDWPTEDYVCVSGRDKGDYNPCAGEGEFEDWANWCVPFHNCQTSYPVKDDSGTIEGWQARPVKGLDAFTKMWSLASVEDGLHVDPGERCYDVLRRFGWILHGIQDFYAHSNWVEVFHLQLGFRFDEIPTWTSFQKAQRGEKLNLILKQHAGGDETKAMQLYDTLDGAVQLGGSGWHDTYHKDSDSLDIYSDADLAAHADGDGHDSVDYHEAAKTLAGTETYQLGLQLKANILNNPKLGQAVWTRLFNCVSEMAAYDGVSYDEELETYQKGIWRLKFYSSSMTELCTMIAFAAVPIIGPLIPIPVGPEVAAFCALVPDQKWH